jgi:hypothetical protein
MTRGNPMDDRNFNVELFKQITENYVPHVIWIGEEYFVGAYSSMLNKGQNR